MSNSPELTAMARRAIALVDLTSLNENDRAQDIRALCRRAVTPYGPVAAVCVYPRFVATARTELATLCAAESVQVATVANFPGGDQASEQVLGQIARALADGADEIDVVMPWQALLGGRHDEARDLLAACRSACSDRTLKVILETGELGSPTLIRQAGKVAIETGADFLKTSTGKVAVNATLEAARVLLELIRDHGGTVGFKASGGIRTSEEAASYLALADRVMGSNWVHADHFRFGASSLLDDLIEHLSSAEDG